jgi:hypothetical protein
MRPDETCAASHYRLHGLHPRRTERPFDEDLSNK